MSYYNRYFDDRVSLDTLIEVEDQRDQLAEEVDELWRALNLLARVTTREDGTRGLVFRLIGAEDERIILAALETEGLHTQE